MSGLKKKVVWLPYDFDTAIGINNDGQLVFDYQLEDIDHQQGGAAIYNGQDSVIWKNIRAAFADELAAMYRTLRSSGNLSYDVVEQAFEEHQGKWAEAIFNEDSQFKYIDPFVNDNANYLYMLLGSKAEQRKWWLYNRFRYIDSKYIAGDARNDTIFLRPYAADDITLTPYADIYATIAWDATITQERAARNEDVTLHCPYQTMNGNIVTIYSSSQLADVGDLSGLKVGQIDISSATRLQALKVGDSDSQYNNSNLYSMTFGSNVLLKSIDARNCSGFGDTTIQGHTQTTVDISGCSIIEDIYFDGTKIQGITLPNGGVIKNLSLPNTITNLTILNQPAITNFAVEGDDFSNISTLRLENVSDEVDARAILEDLSANSRVRLIGFHWECTDATEIDGILDILDTMRGLDEQGGNVDTAQVSGEIHTSALTGAQIAEFSARYPFIRFTADHTSSTLSYYNGTTLLHQETVLDGGDGAWTGTATKAQDAQYTYTFAGWSKTDDNTVDADARSEVVADRSIYACFTGTLRKYTVTFVKASADGGGTLQTISNVNYGTTITAASSYTGATPTSSQGSATDYPFEGWNPASATVQGNTVFTAKFGSPIEVAEITDSWDTIIANIDNGTYATKYKVGNYKPLDLGSTYGSAINMQIVAIDGDELADGSGTAPLTFLSKELLLNTNTLYGTSTYNVDWNNSAIRSKLMNDILPQIPNIVASRLQTVIKHTYQINSNQAITDTVFNEKIWIPSFREINYNNSNAERIGVDYRKIYDSSNSRIKTADGVAKQWWTRSASTSTKATLTKTTGANASDNWYAAAYICLGFCLGLEPETIEDDWATILANQNYATDYSIGDTKYLDLGTEGKHLMEIVAINTDDRADGNGKAGLTWISKDLLNTKHKMNPANSGGAIGTGANGGWENCEMRTYLKNTIKPLIPATVRNSIVEVSKISSNYNGALVVDGQTTTEDVWIPSHHEVFNLTTYETQGAAYNNKFYDNPLRVKKIGGTTSSWWLRSAKTNNQFCKVYSGGSEYYGGAQADDGIALGFCTN